MDFKCIRVKVIKMNIWASLYRYSFNKYIVKQFKELENITKYILQGDHPANIKFGETIIQAKKLKNRFKENYSLRIYAKYMDFHSPSIAELHKRADMVFQKLSKSKQDKIVLAKIIQDNGNYIFEYNIKY